MLLYSRTSLLSKWAKNQVFSVLSRGERERRGDSAKPLPDFTLSYTASFQGVHCFPDENSVFLPWCNSFWLGTTRGFLACFIWVISSKYRSWKEKKKSKGRKEERKKKCKVNFSPWAVIFTHWLLGTELTCHSPDVQICRRHPSEMSKHSHQRALSEPSCCGSAVPSLIFMSTLFPWRRSYW